MQEPSNSKHAEAKQPQQFSRQLQYPVLRVQLHVLHDEWTPAPRYPLISTYVITAVPMDPVTFLEILVGEKSSNYGKLLLIYLKRIADSR
jgi:hypothetical protein